MGKMWKPEELEYLQDKWGYSSVKAIAKALGRSENAINIKAVKLKLGAHLDSGQYLSLNQLLLTIGVTGGNSYFISTLQKRGLKIKRHKVRNCSFKVVDISDFWEFAEKNKELFDFSRLEQNVLGIEPKWVNIKRNEDVKKNRLQKPHNEEWTPAEDAELIRLLKMHRYGYAELEQRLRRTSGAIQRRVIDLDIKERPVRANPHSRWTDEQKKLVAQLIKKGSSYSTIAFEVGKSTKAVRGMVGRLFGTENLDKARERMKICG